MSVCTHAWKHVTVYIMNIFNLNARKEVRNILEQTSERIFLWSVTNTSIAPFTSSEGRFSIMLLEVTCICIPSVSTGKTSKCFYINLIWETLELFPVLEMLVHPNIGLSYLLQHLFSVPDGTVHLKNNSTLNPRTSVIINTHSQCENSCWNLICFSSLLTPWPWHLSYSYFFTKQWHIPLRSPIQINLHIYLVLKFFPYLKYPLKRQFFPQPTWCSQGFSNGKTITMS